MSVSVGAIDMVNFGPRDTVPEKFRNRRFVIHNPNVTLMRTTRDENRAIGEWIGGALQPDGGPGAPAAAGGRRLHARCAGQAVSRSGGRQGAVRGARTDRAPDGRSARIERVDANINDDDIRRRRSSTRFQSIASRAARGEPDGPDSSVETFSPSCRSHERRRARPIIGGGAGTGLSAKCEEAGGIDLIVIYNSGRYRMAGRGSLAGMLAYGNANEIVVEMAHEVLPVVKRTPVLAGVNGTDPFCLFDPFLDDLKRLGFSGVQNFPTVGLIDGLFRANLEETGMSYDARGRDDRRAPTPRTC